MHRQVADKEPRRNRMLDMMIEVGDGHSKLVEWPGSGAAGALLAGRRNIDN